MKKTLFNVLIAMMLCFLAGPTEMACAQSAGQDTDQGMQQEMPPPSDQDTGSGRETQQPGDVQSGQGADQDAGTNPGESAPSDNE